MNILVHTLWFSKYKGSEFSVAYNYVVQMAKKHHLYVIVESCSYEINDLSEFSEYSIPNVDFIFVPFSKKMNILVSLGKYIKTRFYSYVIFHEWEKALLRYLKADRKLCESIDCIHFLGPVGWHEIGYLYELNKPCIWGPVGGFTNCERNFYSNYVMTKGWKIILKNIINTLTSNCSMYLRKALKKYDLVIANTTDSQNYLKHHFSIQNLLYYPENSMRISESEIKTQNELNKKLDLLRSVKIKCIWCGSLDDRKMPGMLLDIVGKVKNKSRLYINIVGGGIWKAI